MNLAYYLIATAHLIGALFKTRDLLSVPASRRGGLRFVVPALYLTAAATLLLANASRPIVDELFGVENLARWAGHSCMLLGAASMQIMLADFTRPPDRPRPRAWWRFALAAATITGMAAAIVNGPYPDRVDFLDAYAHETRVAVYMLLFLSFLGWVIIDLLVKAWRYAPQAAPFTRRGLRVISVGCLTGLGYVATKVIFVTVRLNGGTTSVEHIIGPLFALAATLLITTGITLGSWGPSVADWRRQWRTYRQLGPLWRALHRAFPQTHLNHAGAKIRTRLLRRVIEIRDGQLALLPYSLDEEAIDELRAIGRRRGLTGDDLDAAVEAAATAAALKRKSSGHPPSAVSGPGHQAPEIADMDAEVDRLVLVARAFHRPLLALPAEHAGRPGGSTATSAETDSNDPSRTSDKPSTETAS